MKCSTCSRYVIAASILILSAQAVFSKTIYIDRSAPAEGNGQSWATAYRFLQDGLNTATSGDEIWVAAGTYKPDQSEVNPAGTGQREDTFTLVNGITMIGGLSGMENPALFNLKNRDFETNETILSGDLLGDDNNTLTGASLLSDSNRGDNSYHVLKGIGITDSTVIDGFTVTGGAATGNSGDFNKGGGLLNSNNCNPQLHNCLFIRNTAQWGAALYNYRSSNQTDNCRFIHNASTTTGGAVHNGVSLSEMVISNTLFENNFTEGWGGAIYNNNNALLRMDHCRLVNNTAWKLGNTRGGAVANQDNSQVTAVFCTFAGNVCDNEGGAVRNENSSLTLDHCILWSNEDTTGSGLSAQYYNINSTTTINYTCVMGWNPGVSGTGNFGSDPLLADLPGGDVHLKSPAGHWDESSGLWMEDTVFSPCIDAGDPTLWIENEPLGSGGRINIGAYGGTAQASKSDMCTGGVDGSGLLLTDANRDCRVNMTDLAILTYEWMTSTLQPD